MDKFDVVVIGSGPGGYVAAIRCAQLGMKTAIIERYPTLGGTCLNVGCIPSKALLDSSEHFHNAETRFAEHGIRIKELKSDLKQMMKRKDSVVKQNTDGIDYLMKKNKITVFTGHGSFDGPGKIAVKSEKGKKQTIETTHTIIATGSKPAALKGITIDKKRIITSTEALALTSLPKHMIIIGGGVIGLELGSVYARLGSKVSVIEYMDSLIASMDGGLGRELQKVLKTLGMEFYLGHEVTGATVKGGKVTVKATPRSKEKAKALVLEGDYCLVSVGRAPYTKDLGLDKIGVALDEKGRIPVNEQLQTKAAGVYAIGDVVQGAMLAHKAEDEGVFVAEVLAGQQPHIDYNLIPSVVYTWPEVASVGQTEEQLKQDNRKFKAGSFPFKASGRARASMDTEGFIKVLADAQSDEILGVHMIGPRAADMIAEAVVAMEFRAAAEDIARISHAHPTYTEAFREAALAATENRPIHM